jgi:hypothetical protein
MFDWLLSHAWIVALLGSLLAAVGAALAAGNQTRSARARADFEREMRIKAEENLARTNEAIATITGGDSYCQTGLSLPNAWNRIGMMVRNQGRYPCWSVSVRIEDRTARNAWMEREISAGRFPDITSGPDQFTRTLALGNIGPNSMVMLDELQLPAGVDRQDYTVTTSALNGSIETSYDYRLVSGKWLRRIRSVRISAGKSTVIADETDGGFPSGEKP